MQVQCRLRVPNCTGGRDYKSLPLDLFHTGNGEQNNSGSHPGGDASLPSDPKMEERRLVFTCKCNDGMLRARVSVNKYLLNAEGLWVGSEG